MSNVNRVRYGDQMIIPMPVASGTVIEIGDNLCLVTGYLLNFEAMADAGDEDANEAAAVAAFVGLALSASADGETDDVLVQTKGVVMLDLKAAAACTIGTQLQPYAADTNTACADQTVEEGADAIAVCVKTHDDSTTHTLCKLLPNVILDDVAHS